MDELGISDTEVMRRGGPHRNRVRAIKAGSAKWLTRDTKAQLDEVLQWHPGGIDAILRGSIPLPKLRPGEKPPAPSGRASDRILEVLPADWWDRFDELSELRRFGDQVALSALLHLADRVRELSAEHQPQKD